MQTTAIEVEKGAATRPQKTPWWFLLGIYLLSVTVLALLSRKVVGPLDVDGAYYFLVARNLAAGRGLVVDALWHFFLPTSGFPQPAGDLWMPFPSLLMSPALLFGDTFRHAQVAQTLLAALLPLLSYQIAREEGAELPWAALASLLILFAGTVTVHWVDSDCYTAYALVGGAVLYAMGRARREPRWLIAAGILGGLAALTRNDGIMLVGVLWLYTLLLSRRRHLPWKELLIGTACSMAAVFLWGLRNVSAFGQPTPISLTVLLTMRDYGDLFAYQPQPDWAGFWQQGWGTFFSLRGDALRACLTILIADFQGWGLVPLIWTALSLRRRPGLWPAWLYFLALFLVLSGVFPLLVLHGTWSRSLSAFLPTGYACVALGLRGIVARLQRWRPALPQNLLRNTFLGLGASATILVGSSAMALQLQPAGAHPETWQRIGAWLQQHSDPSEVIMAQDPMAVVLYAERRAIGIPHEGLPLLTDIAQQYGVSKVVLVGRFRGLLPEILQDLYTTGASQGPFTLLWEEEIGPDDRVLVYQIDFP